MIEILPPGVINMPGSDSKEGFILLDAVVSLFLISVTVTVVLTFTLDAVEVEKKVTETIAESIKIQNLISTELFTK